MVNEETELARFKKICGDRLVELGIKDFKIVYARRINGNWKVVVSYYDKDDPYNLINSMFIVNLDKQSIEGFQANISTY